jgi:hypothetical protein
MMPGFRHCFVVAFPEGGGSIFLESNFGGVDVLHVPVGEVEAMETMTASRVVTAIVPSEMVMCGLRAPVLWPALFTCVEFCKRMVGLRDWWVWTPYQLYCALGGKRDGR